MRDTPKIGRKENKGVSEQEILQLETRFNITLPQAYKEFLFLGGRYDNMINNFELDYENLDSTQKNAREVFQSVGLKIIRPLWCFAEYNDAESNLFFFLDEGNDPPVYNFVIEKTIKNEKGEEVYFKKTDNSFSQCIKSFIDYALSK